MTRILLFFLLVLAVLAVTERLSCSGTDEKGGVPDLLTPPAPARYFFKDKETLIFNAYSNGIMSGEGRLVYHGVTELDNGRLQRVTLSVQALSMKDDEEIFGSEDFSAPVKVIRQVRVFGRDESIVETYAPDRKSVVIEKSVNGEARPALTLKTDYELGNLLLMLYRIRSSKEMNIGDSYRFSLPTQEFDLFIKAKRRVKVPMGTYDAFILESRPSKYVIWISVDEERIPLRIKGMVPLGLVYLAIAKVE